MGYNGSMTTHKPLFTHSARVRFAETDGMAVVWHGRYLEYLESARIAYLDSLGMPYKSLVKNGYHLPVVELNAQYKAPAHFDDTLLIELTGCQLEGPRLIIGYTIRREKTEILKAMTTHVFLKEGRASRPPTEFVKLLASQK